MYNGRNLFFSVRIVHFFHSPRDLPSIRGPFSAHAQDLFLPVCSFGGDWRKVTEWQKSEGESREREGHPFRGERGGEKIQQI